MELSPQFLLTASKTDWDGSSIIEAEMIEAAETTEVTEVIATTEATETEDRRRPGRKDPRKRPSWT